MDNSLSFAKRLKKLNKNSTKILLNELGYTKESTNNLLAKSRRVLEDIILEQYELMPIKLQMIADYLYEL